MKLKRLLLAAAITLIGATGCSRRHHGRRHRLGHRPRRPLGIPEKNTVDLMPKTIAGQKINYIVLDDGSDFHQGGGQHAQTDHRGQGRRRARLDHHAQLAGDDRRGRRNRCR